MLLFGHGGSGNRGCEAIVRGTMAIIEKIAHDSSITIASRQPQEDIRANIPNVKNYISFQSICKYSPTWFADVFCRHILKVHRPWPHLYNSILKSAEQADICFSIGGDNYCYGYTLDYFDIDRKIQKLNKKMVFWGASVEPKAIDKSMVEDLRRFDLKIVRESITYQGFMDNGIKENVFLHPDPAFTMKSQEVELPSGWKSDGMVGLNISPLVAKCSQGVDFSGQICDLIRHILDSTDHKVCLIPHVTWPLTNDYIYMQQFFNVFQDTGRVLLAGGNLTAPQLKYLISKCRMLIAARTHATIAGYSTCVPTLAIGYSVKAKGIARDIFGTEKELVLPVQSIADSGDLVKGFDRLNERCNDLKDHLVQQMPDYIAQSWKAGERIQSILS